jgi:mycothiol synthase
MSGRKQMDESAIHLLPAEPDRHFAAIASLLSSQETEPSSPQSLLDWYNRQGQHGILFIVAVDSAGRVLGFSGIYRDNLNIPHHYALYLIVEPAYHRQGLGSQLYKDLLSYAVTYGARSLIIRVRDTCEEGIRFATQRGFIQKKHSIEMMFELKNWDEGHYTPILQSLRAQGFRFTNMAELGDTPEARRKLFALNNSAAATDPGSDGIPPWASFEEFNQNVCSSYWYHSDGQIVAIETKTGDWAAMSAITVFQGADHAYNLFTGTDVRYRGRKLAQAVKSLALRRAREFGVDVVRTSHNSENVPMIAIDTKLGYIRTSGTITMEKMLEA